MVVGMWNRIKDVKCGKASAMSRETLPSGEYVSDVWVEMDVDILSKNLITPDMIIIRTSEMAGVR